MGSEQDCPLPWVGSTGGPEIIGNVGGSRSGGGGGHIGGREAENVE